MKKVQLDLKIVRLASIDGCYLLQQLRLQSLEFPQSTHIILLGQGSVDSSFLQSEREKGSEECETMAATVTGKLCCASNPIVPQIDRPFLLFLM